jgi:hypothetical protein
MQSLGTYRAALATASLPATFFNTRLVDTAFLVNILLEGCHLLLKQGDMTVEQA